MTIELKNIEQDLTGFVKGRSAFLEVGIYDRGLSYVNKPFVITDTLKTATTGYKVGFILKENEDDPDSAALIDMEGSILTSTATISIPASDLDIDAGTYYYEIYLYNEDSVPEKYTLNFGTFTILSNVKNEIE